MRLTESDYKLLSYLYHNTREPVTKIAKACRLTREQVDYKIKKYTSEGLIKGFYSFFDYSKFGYNTLVVLFLKLRKHSDSGLVVAKLKKSKHCISYGRVFNRYDLFCNMIFRDEKELGDFVADLAGSEFFVSEYFVLKPYFTELYPVKFFQYRKVENFVLTPQNTKSKFDDKELQIMKILSENSRARVIDISQNLNISAELVVYKMKKLLNDKVIVGSRIQFDMGKLGYYFSILMINARDFSKENQGKIKQFARNSKFVHSLNLQLTRPNCAIQIFHKEESELRKTINEIKEKFGESEIDVEIFPIGEDEGKADILPFIR